MYVSAPLLPQSPVDDDVGVVRFSNSRRSPTPASSDPRSGRRKKHIQCDDQGWLGQGRRRGSAKCTFRFVPVQRSGADRGCISAFRQPKLIMTAFKFSTWPSHASISVSSTRDVEAQVPDSTSPTITRCTFLSVLLQSIAVDHFCVAMLLRLSAYSYPLGPGSMILSGERKTSMV